MYPEVILMSSDGFKAILNEGKAENFQNHFVSSGQWVKKRGKPARRLFLTNFFF